MDGTSDGGEAPFFAGCGPSLRVPYTPKLRPLVVEQADACISRAERSVAWICRYGCDIAQSTFLVFAMRYSSKHSVGNLRDPMIETHASAYFSHWTCG